MNVVVQPVVLVVVSRTLEITYPSVLMELNQLLHAKALAIHPSSLLCHHLLDPMANPKHHGEGVTLVEEGLEEEVMGLVDKEGVEVGREEKGNRILSIGSLCHGESVPRQQLLVVVVVTIPFK